MSNLKSQNYNIDTDTIVAQATPQGKGGVGVVRISGSKSLTILKKITKISSVKNRYAHYLSFFNEDGSIIDIGIVIFFKGPNSFTGEDVAEFHGHGGSVVIDTLIQTITHLGAKLAKPGEFTERAFLNNKIDLTQAEAIADLIDSESKQAAKSALRSLQGAFSDKVNSLVESLTQLRIYVEAAIDFPEEEIDFLSDGKIEADLKKIKTEFEYVFKETKQGSILNKGMNVVIAGKPNAGKSSLLNALAGKETAIVTDIEGTTRDVIKEHINIDGMPLHFFDTAGLRESNNAVEKIGVNRALKVISDADRILLVVDSTITQETDPQQIWKQLLKNIPPTDKITLVRNKIDISGEKAGKSLLSNNHIINICAKTGEGIEAIKQHLKQCMCFEGVSENTFSARRRHVEALKQASDHLTHGEKQFIQTGAGELLAEDLRLAQISLGYITGAVSTEDLLGKIFSSFCIGK